MEWYEYALKRLLLFVPILFGVSVLVFLIIHLVPGSPAIAMLGVKATPERVAAIEEQLGLHRPFLVQYLEWIGGVLTGDLGPSYSFNAPVSSLLVDRFLISLELVLLTLVAALALAIPMGVLAAIRKNSALDYLAMGIGVTGVSIPTFFSAVLLMALLAVWANVLPVSGYVAPSESVVENLRHMVLPVTTLTLVAVAVSMRMMRSSMIETLGEEYVRFLRAKGLSQRSVLFGHALKNSFIPVITVIGLQFGYRHIVVTGFRLSLGSL